MKSYPTYGQSLGLLLILLLCSVVSVLAVLPFFSIDSGVGLSLVYTLSISLTIVVALSIRKDFSFPVKSFSLSMVVVASITIISMHLFLEPLTELVPVSDSLKKMILETIKNPMTFFFMIVIAAPTLEELLFRGVILDGLLKNYSPQRSVVFSAFLFAVVHGNLAQGIGAFIIGLLIGWIYWKTHSVIPGIIIHFVNNLVAFAGIMLVPEEDIFKSTQEQMGNAFLYWLMVAGCGIIAIGGTWMLHRKYFKEAADIPDSASGKD